MQVDQSLPSFGSEARHRIQNLNIQLDQKHDPHHRNAIYNIFVKAAEDLEAKEQLEREAAAEQEDD